MKKILILILTLLTISCNKAPKNGCLDTAADNYNKKSETNCCCKYSVRLEFSSDTVNVNNYYYFIDNIEFPPVTRLDMPQPSRTINYVIKDIYTYKIFGGGFKNLLRTDTVIKIRF